MSQSPDEKFFLWMNGWAGRSRAADQLWRGAAFLVPFVSTLTCLAVLVHDPHAARHFWLMAGAVAGAQIVTRLVRLAWHRPRPYLNAHLHVRRLLDKGDEAAFPSAHASSLFALADACSRSVRRSAARSSCWQPSTPLPAW
jgi:hypothetical protein